MPGTGNVHLDLTAEDKAVVAALNRAQRKLDDLQGKLSELGKAGQFAGKNLEDAGQSAGKAFDPSRLTSMVTQFVSFSAAVESAKKLMDSMAAERAAGGAGLERTAAAGMKLTQYAGGDPAKLAAYQKAIRESRTEEGLSAEAAGGLQTSLEAKGWGRHRQLFAGLHEVTEPGAFAESVATAQEAFGQGEKDPRAMVNQLLKGSRIGKTSVEKFAPAVTGVAEAARDLKTSDAETIAVLGVLSESLKSPEQAKEQMEGLAKVMRKHGLGGKGVLGGIPGLEQQLKELETAPALTAAETLERAANLRVVQSHHLAERAAAGKELKPEERGALRKEEEFAQKEKEGANVEGRIKEYFGRGAGYLAYQEVRRRRKELDTAVAEVTEAGAAPAGMDLATLVPAAISQVPTLAKKHELDIARERHAIALEEETGPQQLSRQMAIEQMVTKDLTSKSSPVERAINRALFKGAEWAGETLAPTETLKGTHEIEPSLGPVKMPGFERIARGTAKVYDWMAGRGGDFGEADPRSRKAQGLGIEDEAGSKLNRAADKLDAAAQSLATAVRQMHGGPTLARPNEDR